MTSKWSTDPHDQLGRHHHCSECGGVITGTSSIHPRCETKANLEVELEAFKNRRSREDEAEEEEKPRGFFHSTRRK